jgi:hypothetical protein
MNTGHKKEISSLASESEGVDNSAPINPTEDIPNLSISACNGDYLALKTPSIIKKDIFEQI